MHRSQSPTLALPAASRQTGMYAQLVWMSPSKIFAKTRYQHHFASQVASSRGKRLSSTCPYQTVAGATLYCCMWVLSPSPNLLLSRLHPRSIRPVSMFSKHVCADLWHANMRAYPAPWLLSVHEKISQIIKLACMQR